MTESAQLRQQLLTAAFKMPLVQTMVSRKSSITNAFVNAVIPATMPSSDEIEEALQILCQQPHDVRCAYCGDKASEWDHLRPLVLNRRPTGYVTEIGNLVPSCGKCNQSKGNKPWRDWMRSATAKLSPTGRGIADVEDKIRCIEQFENWRPPTKVDFVALIGGKSWEEYWGLCEKVIAELQQCQQVATSIRQQIADRLKNP